MMKVKEKIFFDNKGLSEHGPVNIVILGDSVSQGSIIDNCDYESIQKTLPCPCKQNKSSHQRNASAFADKLYETIMEEGK